LWLAAGCWLLAFVLPTAEDQEPRAALWFCQVLLFTLIPTISLQIAELLDRTLSI
jgi:hypothetical protein